MKISMINAAAVRANIIVAVLIMCAYIFGGAFAHANDSGAEPAWTSPSAMTIKHVGYVPNMGQGHTAMVDNLDCQEMTRPLMSTGAPQSGCFMNTAFGSLDVENDILNLAGSDGSVVPLRPYLAREYLLPWPGTTVALALDPAATDGSYLNLYTDILLSMRDELDMNGAVIAKQVTAPPNRSVVDGSGNKLIVNGNSITFSSAASWMVAETMSGSFVRINLATLDVKAFAPSIIRVGGAAGLNESQLAISDNGRYVAVANQAADTLRVYDLSTCQANSSKPYMTCNSYNYWPFVNSQIGTVDRLSHLRFMDTGLLSLVSARGNLVESYLLAPTAGITALTKYLAVGDSYTSGEGAYDYREGTDTDNNVCHLSNNSYPLLLTQSLFNSSSGHSVACSGATIQDVLPKNALSYAGQVKNGTAKSERSDDNIATILSNFSPGQLAQSDFIAHYQPGVLTVSISGNDIGFGSILEECAGPHINAHLTGSNSCFATYEDRLELAQRIDRQASVLTEALKKIHSKSPDTSMYIVGYPQIAIDTGNCALNVHLNTSEIELSIEVIQHLNTAISHAAQASGGTYVDISQALAGHRLCETNSNGSAVNGLTAGKASGITLNTALGDKLTINFLGKESYHPNKLGHYLIEQAILKQTHNFSITPTDGQGVYPPAASDQTGLLNKPKSGRATAISSRDDTIVKNKAVNAGDQLYVSVVGNSAGLKPNTPYTITTGLGGQVTSTNTMTTDTSGNLIGSATIPATTPPGVQTVNVFGNNQLNQPISITTTIYVLYSPDDYDGDGIVNTNDSCPTTVNSNQDEDSDSVDDSCDGSIETTLPPISGTSSTPPSNPTGTTLPATNPSIQAPNSGIAIEPASNSALPDSNSNSSLTTSYALLPVQAMPANLLGVLNAANPNQDSLMIANSAAYERRPSSFKLASSSIHSVLGSQTADPSRVRSTAALKIQSTDNPLIARDHLLIVQWLPWARLLILSLFILVVLYFVLVTTRHTWLSYG